MCEYLSLRVDSSVALKPAALVYGDLKSGPVKLFGVFFEAAFPAKRAYPALERGKVFLRLDHRLVSFYGDFALFYGDQSGCLVGFFRLLGRLLGRIFVRLGRSFGENGGEVFAEIRFATSHKRFADTVVAEDQTSRNVLADPVTLNKVRFGGIQSERSGKRAKLVVVLLVESSAHSFIRSSRNELAVFVKP